MFPGQGTRFDQVGQSLYESSASFRGVINRASDVLRQDVRLLITGEHPFTDTESVHIAMYTFSTAAVAHLADLGVHPGGVIGHSLGEFTALSVAGCVTWEEGLHLVSVRGRLMAEACSRTDGTMAAIVGLPPAEVALLCEQQSVTGIVVPANYNSPAQTVISGEASSVAQVCTLAQERGGVPAFLPVAGAFHSPLMAEAERQFAEHLRAVRLREPRVPVISSLTAEPIGDVTVYHQELERQMTRPVQWLKAVHTALEQRPSHFVEVGPGRVLSGLMRQIKRSCRSVTLSELLAGTALPAAVL